MNSVFLCAVVIIIENFTGLAMKALGGKRPASIRWRMPALFGCRPTRYRFPPLKQKE
jgi:hypothetical protein